MTILRLTILSVAVLMLVACGRQRTNLGLEVDLYLHPEAANADDLMLQTAIRKQLKENERTRESVIHVRVVDSVVFLSGSVKSQEIKDEATAIAKETKVTLNSQPLNPPSDVKNRIEVVK